MRHALALLLAAAAVCSACNQDTPAVPTSPAPVTTENFSGTVQPAGSDAHTFTVALSNGLLTMTLTSAGPPSNVVLGIGVGQPDATGACTLLSGSSTITAAGPGPHLSGAVSAGTYCSLVFDSGANGGLPGPVTYTLVVTHY